MMFKFVCFVWLFAAYVHCVPKAYYTAEFDLQIEEKGAEFEETVRTDIINNVVYYHTPAHNDLTELYRIQDFNQNLEVSCLPLKSECHMSKLNRVQYPDASEMTENLVEGYKQSQNKISDKKPMDEIANRKYKTGRIIDTSLILSRPIQIFVAEFGFPVYEVEIVPDNAIMLEKEDNSTVYMRKRRQATPDMRSFPKCAGDAAPTRKYGYTSTRYCDYLTFCDTPPSVGAPKQGQTRDSGCDRRHIRDQIFYSCLCCPEHTRVSTCHFCSQI